MEISHLTKEQLREEKKATREKILQLRESLSRQEHTALCQAIYPKLFSMKQYKDAKRILLYAGYNKEINTFPILEDCLQHGKRVFFPKVTGDNLAFFEVTSRDDMASGYCGIMEPDGTTPEFIPQNGKKDVLILPGTVFDRSKNRIGYGRGFYDRYLFDKDLFTIALCFEFQILPEIVHDTFDKKADILISERSFL